MDFTANMRVAPAPSASAPGASAAALAPGPSAAALAPQSSEDTIIPFTQGQQAQPQAKERNQKPTMLQTHNENQIVLITEAINSLDLSAQRKLSIKHRFLSLLQEYTFRSKRYSTAFHTLRIIISVGSLIVPALLSVQFTGGSSSTSQGPSQQIATSTSVYWVVWVLSLFVTISNALMTLMKIDKKYFTLHTTLHHIVSEGWLYIELSGKYSGFHTPGETPTHENQYVYFCQTLEKIRMKQIGDEYYKLTDANQQPPATDKDQMIPPTPFKVLPLETNTQQEKTGTLNKEDETSNKKGNE
jgi:hypothetical protein